MVDITTGTSAVLSTNGQFTDGIAGAAVTINQAVYLDESAGTWKLTDADALATAGTQVGVALNTAPSGGHIRVARQGVVTMSGATIAVAIPYFLSTGAGGICPIGDLASGDFVTYLGMGYTTTSIDLHPHYTGKAIA